MELIIDFRPHLSWARTFIVLISCSLILALDGIWTENIHSLKTCINGVALGSGETIN